MADETRDGSTTQGAAIEVVSDETRTFPPPAAFKKDALVADTSLYDEAARDYEGFWARQAAELLTWSKDWDTICDWELPFAKWFVGGELNVAANCLDRHVEAGKGDKVAYYWEGEPGDTRVITYAELLGEVQRLANVLKGLGVQRGDRVQHLPADDPRAARVAAGLRPHRGGPLGGVRRLLARRAGRPHQRRRGEGAHHRRRRVAAGGHGRAQGQQRRGPREHAEHRARRRGAAHGPGRPHGARP